MRSHTVSERSLFQPCPGTAVANDNDKGMGSHPAEVHADTEDTDYIYEETSNEGGAASGNKEGKQLS